ANYRLAGSTATRTLSPLADASVRSGVWGNTNFGSGAQLYAKESTDADSTRRIYLKFDLSSLATIGTAKLRLFGRLDDAIAGRGTTVGVFGATNTSWTESGLTWNNSPSFGTTALATASVTSAAAKWYEWDLTSYLRQQKAAGRTSVTLVLKTTTLSKEKATFNSDEAATNRPQLVVTV
ncbi:MAG TPA: DNRLRE domain-containing protein, partial [Tepidisphaeraceae bacterium]|nr:DNRLRE domain-containing protein [Tepidisphaeraceae bacterium]